MDSKNPYRWNQIDLTTFLGRVDIMLDMSERLSTRNTSFSLIGGRRMGKTMMLRKIEETISKNNPQLTHCNTLPVYIDFQTLGPTVTLSFVWAHILDCVFERASFLHIGKSETLHLASEQLKLSNDQIPYRIVADAIRAFLRSMPLGAIQLVILMDEVERLLLNDWCEDFWRNWRALIHNTPGVTGNLSIVVSGSIELCEIWKDRTSSLFGILEPMFLHVLSNEEGVRLIREPSQIKIDESLCHKILELSGGHPFIIQYIMGTLVDMHDFSDAAIESAKSTFIEKQEYTLRTWWSQLNSNGQTVYRELAASVEPLQKNRLVSKVPIEEVNWALDVICSTGIGYQVTRNNYACVGKLFYYWAKELGLLEQQKESVFISEKAKTKTASILEKYSVQEWQKRSTVDQKLKIVELELRQAISKVLQAEYQDKSEIKIRACLSKLNEGGDLKQIEDRCQKAVGKYHSHLWVPPTSLIHYTTIGHLETIIGSEWEKFNFIFGIGKESRKRFADIFMIIGKMRNELSHPLPIECEIPETELKRAEVACDDVLNLLSISFHS